MKYAMHMAALALGAAFVLAPAQAGNDKKYMDDAVPYWKPVEYVASKDERDAAHAQATEICRRLHGFHARARINWVQRRIWCYLR